MQKENEMKRTINALFAGTLLTLTAGAAFAHPHMIGHNGQVLANGQNHPAFINGTSCQSYPSAGPAPVGPAWYGLETAHHGPDAGTPGKKDGCYQTTGSVPPGQDVQSPVIR
jgi:hypothetical protein